MRVRSCESSGFSTVGVSISAFTVSHTLGRRSKFERVMSDSHIVCFTAMFKQGFCLELSTKNKL